MKSFTMQLSRYGEEIVLGTLTNEQGKYWSQKTNQELMDHVTRFSEDDQETISETFRLRDWDEIDDLVHAYGPHLSLNLNLTVTDENDNVVFDCDFDKECAVDHLLDNLRIDVKHDYDVIPEFDPGYYFFAHSGEKGSFVYEKFSDERFDPSKLVFEVTSLFKQFRVIKRVLYDGQELGIYDSSNRGVVFACEIINGKFVDGSHDDSQVISSIRRVASR
jgi:hypothetical protein